MYLLNLWIKKNFPTTNYDLYDKDPDPEILKRKKLLKDAREMLRNQHMQSIINDICTKKNSEI